MKPLTNIRGAILSLAATASLLAQAPTLTTLYSFTGNQSLPIGSVAIGAVEYSTAPPMVNSKLQPLTRLHRRPSRAAPGLKT